MFGQPYKGVFAAGAADQKESSSPDEALLQLVAQNRSGGSSQPAVKAVTPEQKAQLETYLQHPNVQAYLSIIANAEGATYDTLITRERGKSRRFSDYSRYPGEVSGRYQIVPNTYRNLTEKLGVDDFSPHTQDLMATQKLLERGVIDQILRGDVLGTLGSASKEWAALPQGPGRGSYYEGQPAISSDKMLQLFDLCRSP
jgi:muramidase (phage lysozyme)